MSNDNWRTPDWLFYWLNTRYGPFDIDLAASNSNTKCVHYYSLDNNALSRANQWHLDAKNGFCNPPYSHLAPWLVKASQENALGFTSTWILPAWNGERFWYPTVFTTAAEEIRVLGRIGFLDPFSSKEIKSNRAGTIIAHFSGKLEGFTTTFIDRDELIALHQDALSHRAAAGLL